MKTNYNNTSKIRMQLLALCLFWLATPDVKAQWSKLSAPSPYYPANYITTDNNTLYTATNSGIYSSTDNGASWNDLTQGFASSASGSNREIVFTPNHIYIRTTTASVYRSPDNGITWEYDSLGLETGSNYGQREILSLYYDNSTDRLYASKPWPSYGLYYKQPSDPSWTKINSNNIGNSGYRVWGVTRMGTKLYAATEGGFYESSDGVTFSLATGTNFPFITSPPGNRASNPLIAVGNDLYYCAEGIHKSGDGGSTWNRIDQGFAIWNFGIVWTSAIYYDGSSLYAAVNVSGDPDSAYVSPDGGSTWTDMSDGGLTSEILSFAKHNGAMYATTFGKDSIWVYGGNSSTGLEQFPENLRLSVSPNPASENLVIDAGLMQSKEPITLKIYSVTGQEALNTVIQPSVMNEMSIRSLPAGIYIIHAVQSNRQFSTKLVIRK